MFDPRDWYWLADDGRFYGSRAGALVDPADPAVEAWRADGRHPTRWPADEAGEQTDAALQAVLAPYGLRLWLDAETSGVLAGIDAERERRTDAGFTFAGHLFQSRPADRENIAGAATAALRAIIAGAEAGDLRWHGGDSDFVWIAADNDLVPMDAQTAFAFGQAAMAHKSRLIFQARAMKDADPIPPDYTDDRHWPLAG